MLLPLAIAGAYWRELIALPRYLRQLGQQYDSLTRLVYSGMPGCHRRFSPEDAAGPDPHRAGAGRRCHPSASGPGNRSAGLLTPRLPRHQRAGCPDPADGGRHDPDGQHRTRDCPQHPGHQRPGDRGAQQLPEHGGTAGSDPAADDQAGQPGGAGLPLRGGARQRVGAHWQRDG